MGNFKKSIGRVLSARANYENEYFKLDEEIKKVCEFNAGLTFCQGDGHLVINVDTARVAGLGCLQGISETNKLTIEEFNDNTI